MNSLLKRFTGDHAPGDGDAPASSIPQTVANSVHSLIQRLTGPAMLSADLIVGDTSQQHSAISSPVEAVTTQLQLLADFDSPKSPSPPVNNSTVAAFTPDPRNAVKSSFSATGPGKRHNARRQSLDPLARYFSHEHHAFPDYGSLGSRGNMSFLKRVNDAHAMKPINTMSTRPQTMPFASRNSTGRPAVKRQRTDHFGQFNARYPPPKDMSRPSRDQLAKMERRGSHSVTSAEEKTYSQGVEEYRTIEGMHDPNKRSRVGTRRGRPHRGKLLQMDNNHMGGRDPIESDDSYSDPRPTGPSVGPSAEMQGASRSNRRPVTDSADLEILGDGSERSRPPPAQQNFAHTMNRSKKRCIFPDIDSEPDELSNDHEPFYASGHANKKPNNGQSFVPPPQSSSISTQGDPKPSLDAQSLEGVRASEFVHGGLLPVKMVLWKPDRLFDASSSPTDGEEGGRAALISQQGQDQQQIVRLLHPGRTAAIPPEFDWFLLRPKKVERVKISDDHFIAKLVMPVDIDKNLGPILYLQFYSRDDTERFDKWVRQHVSGKLEYDQGDSLKRELVKQHAEVKKRPEPKVRQDYSQIPTTDASARGSSHSYGRAAEAFSAPKRSTRSRLIDAMGLGTPLGVGSGTPRTDNGSPAASRPQRQLRSRVDLSPEVTPPDHWTELNPGWDKDWRVPLAYHRTMVDKDDIPRLDEGMCLNDNIIGFYLKYLQLQAEAQQPETAKRIYFHNSFFYTKLKPTSGRNINYDGVKNWTAKVDLFSYDYVVVPVNEHFHWWVAIICNPGRLDSTVTQKPAGSQAASDDEVEEVLAISLDGKPSARDDDKVATQETLKVVADDRAGVYHLDDPYRLPDDSADDRDPNPGASSKDGEDTVMLDDDSGIMAGKSAAQKGRKPGRKPTGPHPRKYNPADPRIITLDSLGASHSPVCGHLKQYLIAEFKDKKGKDIEYKQPLGMRATNLPEQDNFCDCGVYLLKYVAEFLNNPDKFIQGILLRKDREWDFSAPDMRNDIRKLIFDLHGLYQQEQEEARRLKAIARRKREEAKPTTPANVPLSSPPRSSAERATSPQKAAETVKPTRVASQEPPPPVDVQGSRLPTTNRSQTLVVEIISPRASRTSRMADVQVAGHYDTRGFCVIDDKDNKKKGMEAPSPQSVQVHSLAQTSQPIPSIEIADEEAPGQMLQGADMPSIEGPDDNIVEVSRAGPAPPHGQKRTSLEPDVEIHVAEFYRSPHRRPQEVDKSIMLAKHSLSSPPAPQSSGLGRSPQQKSDTSPYFVPGPMRTPATAKTTYSRARKTPNGGTTIDLTDD